ncbi:MAG: lytic transglycosylase domain-containing protein [Pyrinomonadaceae bacterium]
MTQTTRAIRSFSFVMALTCCAFFVTAHAKKTSKRMPQVPEPVVEEAMQEEMDKAVVQLKLKDGTRVTVEEAWESEQGIWYRQGGMTHLVARDRVKAIERGSDAKPKAVKPIAKVTEVKESPSETAEQPVWIHLIGGARVEADSANEQASGVWYKRGSLSIFIERSRIDHIERESLAVAESPRRERGWSTGRPRIDALIRQNGAKYGVDPYLIFCVMEQESHFNAYALSPKGARGLMQLMPGTAARFGVRHSFDPGQNIAGGTRYLKQLMAKFNGRVDLVLASYNAGEGAVVRFGHRVPPYRETRNYVKRISFRYRQAKSPSSSPTRNTVSAGGL